MHTKIRRYGQLRSDLILAADWNRMVILCPAGASRDSSCAPSVITASWALSVMMSFGLLIETERAIRVSDPRWASTLSIFGRLNFDEEMSQTEQQGDPQSLLCWS
jgi:hypothetical protein